METKNTLRSVLHSKVVFIFKNYSLKEIILKPLLVLFLAACFISRGQVLNIIFSFYNFAIPSLICSACIVYLLPHAVRLSEEIEEIESMESIEGVDTYKLVDFLFKTKRFKRAELESIFKIPRARIELLGQNLEAVNILKRGENNARVLGSVSKEFVINFLKGKTVAEELEKGINIVHSPTLPVYQTTKPQNTFNSRLLTANHMQTV